jgi:hypothetical protein
VITSIGKHYAVTLDRDATSFLGLNLAHNVDNTVTVTQPKLLTKLLAPHPTPQKRGINNRATPYSPLPKDTDPNPTPTDPYAYLHLLGMLLYITKSRLDIMAAASFVGTKSSHPTDKDMSDLYYDVEYLRATQDVGRIIHPSESNELSLYCKVDASYLLHPDSKDTQYRSTAQTVRSTTAASNKQPLPPSRPTLKPAQYSHSPKTSISSSPSAKNYYPSRSSSQQSSWRTTAQSSPWRTTTPPTPRSANTS